MGYYLTVVCDTSECSIAQSLRFDERAETFGDMLDALQSKGWDISGDLDKPEELRFSCELHDHEAADG